MKIILPALTLAALLCALWLFQGASPLTAWLPQAPTLPAMPSLPGLTQAGAPTSPPAAVHKCRQGQAVVYSDAPCAPGQQAQALGGGAVTVIPGQGPKPGLRAPSASLPHAGALRGQPGEPALLDKQIEQAMERPGQ